MSSFNHREIICSSGEIVHSYYEYLKTMHWRCVREMIYSLRHKRCEKCNCKLKLYNVHHLTYDNIGYEKESDLMLVCKKCHDIIHGRNVKKKKTKKQKPISKQQKFNYKDKNKKATKTTIGDVATIKSINGNKSVKFKVIKNDTHFEPML